MFSKVLVANRGEIAIRAFRASYELGAATVAVFPFEDRNSVHRTKADEAYEIGEKGHPVRAYLSVAEIVAAAKRSGADAVYPGYGFLSENPELAEKAAANGIVFRRCSAADRKQSARDRGGQTCRSAGAGFVGAVERYRRTGGRVRVDDVSVVRQSGCRWRRPRYAPCRRTRAIA